MADTGKKKSKRGNLVIYIFPYLFFDKEQAIDGYNFKPSIKEMYDKESNRVRGHLKRLAKTFSFRSSPNIFQYTYGHTIVHNAGEWEKLKLTLDTISNLLRYQELSDLRSSVDYSNFDYAAFEISQPIRRDDRVFYRGVLNGMTDLAISYPRTKFCPNHELRPHVFYTDNDNKTFNNLMFFSKLHIRSELEKNRLLRSMEWFNKSFKNDPEVDNYERIISLAVAFETLFNSPEQGIQASLAAGVTTLLGETEEMTHWVKEFYAVRCGLVHGREQSTIAYKGKASREYHLNHLVFARKVFVKCVKAIFSAREQVYTEDLHKELISNERRIREILEGLKKYKTTKGLYEARIFEKIETLSNSDASGSAKDVRFIGKLLLPYTRGVLVKQKDTKMVELLDYIVEDKESDLGNLAVKYDDFSTGYGPYYFEDKAPITAHLYGLVLTGAIYNFVGFATWKLMNSAFNNNK